MHSKIGNIEIMINGEADEVIKELFDLLKNRYQNDLESIVFNWAHLLHYKCHKLNSNRGRSCIVSLDWINNHKTTINLINKKDKQRMTKIKPFINQYNWEGIYFPSEKVD